MSTQYWYTFNASSWSDFDVDEWHGFEIAPLAQFVVAAVQCFAPVNVTACMGGVVAEMLTPRNAFDTKSGTGGQRIFAPEIETEIT